MNRLGIVKFLIEEIEYEQKLPELIRADQDQATARCAKDGREMKFARQYEKYRGRQPSKARITNNCKKIRQLMLDISREGNK